MKMINEKDEMMVPARATVGSAGYDIKIPYPEVLKPSEYVVIDTGLKLTGKDFPLLAGAFLREKPKKRGIEEIRGVHEPYSWVALIFPRSSLGFNYGFRFANTICVIDQDYRDTIKLKVTVDKELELKAGDRIAQIIFIPYLALANESIPTLHRDGGIGSTGI